MPSGKHKECAGERLPPVNDASRSLLGLPELMPGKAYLEQRLNSAKITKYVFIENIYFSRNHQNLII